MWAACRAKQFGASVLLEGSRIFTEFKGALTEQYVLQQLIATQENPVFYWATEKGTAEVDFVVQGEGMRRLTREHCDMLVSIPMFGTVESMNVSVSAGMVLSETRRQRVLKAEK